MKHKLPIIFTSALLALTLTACGSSGSQDQSVSLSSGSVPESSSSPQTEAQGSAAESTESTVDSRILVAYFSAMETDGTDTVSGASRIAVDGDALGNNEYVAHLIAQQTGGDIFSIETVQDYPATHDELLQFAHDEQANGTKPELNSHIDNLDEYDIIFLGFPNWNADLPMPMYTFLAEYDLSGKTIIPFSVHGGSGFSGNIETISSLQPDANVESDGLSIYRDDVADAESVVTEWLSGLDLTAE